VADLDGQYWDQARGAVPARYRDNGDGTFTPARESSTPQCDYDVNGNLIYYGTAVPGSATSAPAWGIKKLFYDGSGNFLRWLWAGGTPARTNVWDNRTALIYS
jgi:hypothetical protein